MTFYRIARVVGAVPVLALGIASRVLPAQAPLSVARPIGVRSAAAMPTPAALAAPPPLLAAAAARRRNHEGTGALFGALAGGTVLVLAVNNCERHSTSTDGPPCAIGYAFMPAFLGVGALLGAAVGHFIPREQRADRLRPSAAPTTTGPRGNLGLIPGGDRDPSASSRSPGSSPVAELSR